MIVERGGVRFSGGAALYAGAAGARGGAAGLTGGNAGGGGGESGAVQSSPWSHTPAAGQVRLLKQLRCRRTVEVSKILATIPKVSSTSVALPGAHAPRGSGGRLTKEAAAAWCTTFSPISESLHVPEGGGAQDAAGHRRAGAELLLARWRASARTSWRRRPASSCWPVHAAALVLRAHGCVSAAARRAAHNARRAAAARAMCAS